MNRVRFDSKSKIWSGPKRETIYNANISVGALALGVLQQTPELVAQVSADDGVELTCHEIRSRTIRIASDLMTSGLKQGDVVGVVATNTENVVPLVLACLALGLPINTLAPVMIESDIIHMYSRTKPKIIFCDADIVETIQAAANKLQNKPEICTLVAKVGAYKFVNDIIAVDIEEEALT